MVKRSDWVKVARGSFGSRNGQPWSRELATANARTTPSDTSAGMYGAVIAPSKEALLSAIAAQTCPWCGRGPFKVLASHTNKEHGVDRLELRRLADLSSSASICSPDTSGRARASLAARNADGSLSVKGGQAAAERGIHFLGARVRVDKLSATNKVRDEAILSDYRSGFGREEIASRNATGTAVVARVLSAAGIVEDGRKQAAKIRDIGDRLKKASAEAAERASQGKVTRYLELGGDWAAIHQAAAEFSVSAKSFAALMRNRGVHVPDGRK
ncbi:hypothetical protein AHiyo6_03890 [Arthrobacter sp. Hiyo6]|nr:hypothetical protein AHiyo6_03890 [Arthrobacter sp. Hiyo6]